MNKKNNRKGFTTVEMVIVIAVIAILATVLIPTFSNLIGEANKSAALQEANSALKTWMANPDNAEKFTDETVLYIVANDNVFKFSANALSKTPEVGNETTPVKLPCNQVIGEDGAYVQRVMEAAYESATENGIKKSVTI